MKKLEDYMNDPSVINDPMPLREIHAIRLMIYDETKDMTPEERIERTNKIGEAICKKYGLIRVVSAKERVPIVQES